MTSNWCIHCRLWKWFCLLLTHLLAMHPFPTPWKHQKAFWCFQGIEKGCIGSKWVKVTLWNLFNVVNNYIKLKNKSYLGPYQRFMIPVDTRRRFNVYKTYRRRIDVLYDVLDVETSSCVCWNRAFLFHDRCLIGSWTHPSLKHIIDTRFAKAEIPKVHRTPVRVFFFTLFWFS